MFKNIEEYIQPLEKEPLRSNRFLCFMTLNGNEFDPRVVTSFLDNDNYLDVELTAYEGLDYEKVLREIYNTKKCEGKVIFICLSPENQMIKQKIYSIDSVYVYNDNKYSYDNDSIVKYAICLGYTTCEILNYTDEHLSTKPLISKEEFNKLEKNTKRKGKDAAFLKASMDMLEDAKKRVCDKYSHCKNTEELCKEIIGRIEESKNEISYYAKEKGFTDKDIKDAVFKKANGYYVEKYNKWKKKKEKEIKHANERQYEDTDDVWYEICDDTTCLCEEAPKKKTSVRRDVFSDDYGNQFPDEFPEDREYYDCCGHECC